MLEKNGEKKEKGRVWVQKPKKKKMSIVGTLLTRGAMERLLKNKEHHKGTNPVRRGSQKVLARGRTSQKT